MRYVLCATAPETKDNDFTWKDFQTRNNSELVAILGNFVNRAVVLTHKFFDGKVPAIDSLQDIDKETIEALKQFPEQIAGSIEKFRFREALGLVMDLARLGNKYLAETEPWKLIKTDEKQTATILNIALQIAANLSIVAEPFLPRTSEKLKDLLKIDTYSLDDAGSYQLLKVGSKISQATLLYCKIEDEDIEKQIDKLKKPEIVSINVSPQKGEVNFDDFMKMDMRIGTILEAEAVPKSNKLLKFLVDTGIDQRTILSGIAKHYSPEDMIGKQVTILTNLAPRKIMGVESQGMILMAENSDGSLKLIRPNDLADNGATIS